MPNKCKSRWFVNSRDQCTQLHESSLWKCGPQWLQSESHWPSWKLSLKQLLLKPWRNSLWTIHSLKRSYMALMVNNSILVPVLHQNVWIPSIRKYTKKLLWCCVTCRGLEGNAIRASYPSLLAKLRVQEGTPFAVTGVDFAGPLYI